MKFTPTRLNTFLFYKLPSAYWCGVRVKDITLNQCTVTVTHKWFNQNPFKSMYFAVQAMAAELTTGALVMYYIQQSNKKVAMLVTSNKSTFTKKATGKITFTCNQGSLVKDIIERAVATGESQVVTLTSTGSKANGEQVSVMEFEWSIKLRGTALNNNHKL